MKRRLLLPLLLLVALLGICSGAQAREGEFLKFSSTGTNSDGTPSTAAGGRPYELTQEFRLNQAVNPESKQLLPTESLKNVNVELPPGAVGNPETLPHCLERELETAVGCPISSQVGIATTELQLVFRSTVVSPIYNMKAPPGMPVQFAFVVVAPRVHVDFHVRTGNDYGLTATIHNISATAPVWLNKFALWGVPADSSHDGERGEGCLYSEELCPSPEPRLPLLSNPTSCEGPTYTGLSITTWQLPNTPLVAPLGGAPAMTDCNQVDFSPTVAVKPTTNLADSPTGLEFHLNLPQNEDPDGTAEALMRETKVSLPSDLTLNSAAANGLGACSPEQIGYLGLRGERQILRYPRPGTASFTVSREGETTAPISSIADASEVTALLETLPGLAGNIKVEGGAGGWVVVFNGDLAGKDVPELSGEITDNRTETVALTATGGTYNLESGGSITGSEFEASFEKGSTFLSAVNPTRNPKVGEAIEGPGIPPGTVISIAFGTVMILNQGTTEKLENAKLHTAVPYTTTAVELEESLQAMPSIGPNNATVTDLGTVGSTHSFQILFSRQLAGATPTITSSSNLTGPGAGVTVSVDPPTPDHALGVETESEIRTGAPQFTEAPADLPRRLEDRDREDRHAALDHPLLGSIYLATPNRNPFGSLARDLHRRRRPPDRHRPEAAGPDRSRPEDRPADRRPSAKTRSCPSKTCSSNSSRAPTAPLKTGIACGTYRRQQRRDPMDRAGRRRRCTRRTPSRSTRGAGGGPCSKDEASAPNRPSFEAGTFEPTGGRLLALHPEGLRREDGTQQLTGIDTTLPKGLLARLAGVPYCSDAALAARRRQDAASQELADPSCPAASKVGNVTVAAGAGPTPFCVDGSAYLAGPYKGAPLSLAVDHPGGRRALRPRQRRRPQRALHRPGDAPASTRSRTRSRRSSKGSRSTSARSWSTSTAISSPATRPAATRSSVTGTLDHPARPERPGLQQLPGRRLRQARLQAEARAQPQGRHQAPRPPGPEGGADRARRRRRTSPASRSPCRNPSSSTTPTSKRSAPGSSSPPTQCPAGSVYG